MVSEHPDIGIRFRVHRDVEAVHKDGPHVLGVACVDKRHKALGRVVPECLPRGDIALALGSNARASCDVLQ